MINLCCPASPYAENVTVLSVLLTAIALENEMVSTRDTEISLHIQSPRFWASGGEYSGVTTENFNSGGGLWSEIPERGSLENLDTNFSV